MRTATVSQAFELALQHHQAGRLADAETLYHQILAAQPEHAEARHLLGVIAHQVGRHDLAEQWIRQAIAINPNNSAAYSNLGEVYRTLGRLDEAVAAYDRALDLKPNYPEAHNNLGNALMERGRFDESIPSFRRALELRPDYREAHNNLGVALRIRGLDDSIASFRRALEINPDYPETYNNLGNALRDQGRLDEAVASYRRALRLRPANAEVHSNLIYTLHFHPSPEPGLVVEEQQRWNRQFGNAPETPIQTYGNVREPERRLRIGYVSPDFRDHVIGRNLLPLFRCHDRRDFEILCYSGVVQPDLLTEEFRQRALHWRSTVGVADEALADMICEDGADILVDLTQHMAGNRLPVFARHPAPVQVSFAGYPESTGLDAIRYRISDRYLETGASEKVDGRTEQVFLIDGFWCYDPCGVAVEINGLSAQETGTVTFGSLNNFCKVNELVLKLWARVLGSVKDSRLILLGHRGSHQQRTVDFLEREGIGAHRIEFVEPRPRREYIELYHRLDIVLDPFPYNGHTTSLDALWMGVPVVSLAGQQAVSRAGLSQLTNLGLSELVAHSEDEYVAVATQLAHDLPRLTNLHATLRSRMESSVLMDAPRFARQIEAAYRTMWRQWCARQAT